MSNEASFHTVRTLCSPSAKCSNGWKPGEKVRRDRFLHSGMDNGHRPVLWGEVIPLWPGRPLPVRLVVRGPVELAAGAAVLLVVGLGLDGDVLRFKVRGQRQLAFDTLLPRETHIEVGARFR